MGFELLMNGVGNAFSRVHWGTSFVLRDESYCLAVDCPDNYLRALASNDFEYEGGALDVDELDALFITHLHGDHVNGLEMTLAYRRYKSGGELDLYTTPPVASDLWEHRLGAALGQIWNGSNFESLRPKDYYTLHRVPWETESQIGPFSVTTRQTLHHLPASAMRISDGDATLGYSCDTAYDESLIEWLAEADLILHETSPGPGHTSLDKLQDLPEEIREKLVVVHLPDETYALEPEVELEFGREGKIYDVESTA